MKLKVLFVPQAGGGYTALVPGMPGCVSEGDTLEEARANIREAFAGVFEVMQEEPPDPEFVTPDATVEELEV